MPLAVSNNISRVPQSTAFKKIEMKADLRAAFNHKYSLCSEGPGSSRGIDPFLLRAPHASSNCLAARRRPSQRKCPGRPLRGPSWSDS